LCNGPRIAEVAHKGLRVRPIDDADRAAVGALLVERWGAAIVVAHGTVFEPATLAGVVAERDGRIAGVLTYVRDGDVLEIVTIDADPPGAGAGTALVEAAAAAAREQGCRRLRLTTTNDNLDALRFYQRRGFRLVALRPGAVDAARALKPQIPATGAYGISLRDELDLERAL
jgi:ribosomal protein S18 acetylase RimI-like enzyme